MRLLVILVLLWVLPSCVYQTGAYENNSSWYKVSWENGIGIGESFLLKKDKQKIIFQKEIYGNLELQRKIISSKSWEKINEIINRGGEGFWSNRYRNTSQLGLSDLIISIQGYRNGSLKTIKHSGNYTELAKELIDYLQLI